MLVTSLGVSGAAIGLLHEAVRASLSGEKVCKGRRNAGMREYRDAVAKTTGAFRFDPNPGTTGCWTVMENRQTQSSCNLQLLLEAARRSDWERDLGIAYCCGSRPMNASRLLEA